MIKLIKNLFRSRLIKPSTDNITCGKRDKNGFCDTYINGEKTNCRMLVFSESDIKRLYKN